MLISSAQFTNREFLSVRIHAMWIMIVFIHNMWIFLDEHHTSWNQYWNSQIVNNEPFDSQFVNKTLRFHNLWNLFSPSHKWWNRQSFPSQTAIPPWINTKQISLRISYLFNAPWIPCRGQNQLRIYTSIVNVK